MLATSQVRATALPSVLGIASAIHSTSWNSPTVSTKFSPAPCIDGRTNAGRLQRRHLRHVEVRRTGSTVGTFDYQLTGVAVEGLVGLEYKLTSRLAAFGDYKLSFLGSLLAS